MHKRAALIFVVLFVLVLFPACSTIPSSGISIDPTSRRGELTEQFIRGYARLECYASCAGKYGANRADLKMFHDAELWRDLALRVLEIGNYGDQQYYYLGRAAEGLGYVSAAEIYYKLSIGVSKSGRYDCAGLINVCDGFVFPQTAESRLASVVQGKKQAETLAQEKPSGTGIPSAMVGQDEPVPDSKSLGSSESMVSGGKPESREAAAKANREREEQEAEAKADRERQEQEAAAKAERERQQKEAAANAERARQEKEANAKAEQERRQKETQASRQGPKPTGVAVKDSEFDPTATFEGITQKYAGGVVFIRSWVNKKTGDTTHQIYIADIYTSSAWKYWVLASDDQALVLNVRGIHRDVGSCSRYSGCIYEEHVGVDVPDAILKTRSTGEYCIKLKARSGDEKVISLTQDMISSQLEEIERYKIANKLIKPPTKRTQDKSAI